MTMYKLTLALFASFTLILPVFALPKPVREVDGLEKRGTFSGRVQALYSHLAHVSDRLALREPSMNLALVHVVKPITRTNLSSLSPRLSLIMELFAGRYDSFLNPNTPVLTPFFSKFR